jgi:hypothetical protein
MTRQQAKPLSFCLALAEFEAAYWLKKTESSLSQYLPSFGSPSPCRSMRIPIVALALAALAGFSSAAPDAITPPRGYNSETLRRGNCAYVGTSIIPAFKRLVAADLKPFHHPHPFHCQPHLSFLTFAARRSRRATSLRSLFLRGSRPAPQSVSAAPSSTRPSQRSRCVLSPALTIPSLAGPMVSSACAAVSAAV